MAINLFDISRVSAMVALIFSSAYIITQNGIEEGVIFFLLVFVAIFLWWFMECAWIEHKHSRGIDR